MNITFDLETLGKINAPIAQIAAVVFTDEGEIIDTFDYKISLNSLRNYDFNLDYDTIHWWMQQDDAAIKAVFGDGGRHDLKNVLEWFSEFIKKNSQYGDLDIWSHATFDPPIISHAYNEVGITNPLFYRWHRDIRTLTMLSGVDKTRVNGIAHNALDDCLNQAKYISKAIQKLKK